MSVPNVVAVWHQDDGINDRIYSNYSTDSGVTWHGAQLIENNAVYWGAVPNLAISGSSAVAVWCQDNSFNQSIYSNYATLASNRIRAVAGRSSTDRQVTSDPPWIALAAAVIAISTVFRYRKSKK
jgi:hypothetical protein